MWQIGHGQVFDKLSNRRVETEDPSIDVGLGTSTREVSKKDHSPDPPKREGTDGVSITPPGLSELVVGLRAPLFEVLADGVSMTPSSPKELAPGV